MTKIKLLLSKIQVEPDLLARVEHFVNGMEFNKSDKTIISYLYDLKLGFDFFLSQGQVLDLNFVSKLDIIQFRSLCAQYRLKKNSITSQQRLIITWRVFLRSMGLNSLDNLMMPKKPQRHPKPLSESDARLVANLPENPTWIDYRNRALWSLMYGSGLRISEALSVREQELGECIKIVGKGKKSRVVPILPKVMEYIKEYLSKRPIENEYVFMGARGERMTQQTASHVFRVWRDRNNLPKNLTLHSLRHSFATHLLRNNCPLPMVQKLLGHSDLARTMQYLSISSDQLQNSYQRHMEDI